MWRRRRPSTGDEAAVDNAHSEAIVAGLAALLDTVAHEVMTPRVDVVALRAPVEPEAVARAVKESGHSRFPVYQDDLDNLLGVLFVKDLFRMSDDVNPASIARRLREPFQVPEGRPALEVLHSMRAGRHAFAVVVDEYGGVAGVLTVKDLVSRLVGELRDEFDADDDPDIEKVDGERWLVDGACSVDRARDELGIEIPDGEYVTIGGLMFDLFGRIPSEGDEIELEGATFRVAEMERRRVAKVVVRRPSGTIAELSGADGTGK